MRPKLQNLFANLPEDRAQEEFLDLLTLPSVRVERITSRGQTTPEGEWYDQEEGEWVMVVTGAAQLLIEGDAAPINMGPGDHIYLPPHLRHRVTWTDPDQDTIWLAVFVTNTGAANRQTQATNPS